jgi:hypothetical protein
VHLAPVLVEWNRPQVLPYASESMHVAVAQLAPIDKFDTQFECALGLPEKLMLITMI